MPKKKSRYRWLSTSGHRNRARAHRLAKAIDENIDAIEEYRSQVEREGTLQDRLADWITRWSGSMWFVYMHVAWFGLWLAANLGLFGIEPFDPYPFGLLTMVVSLEAIFLATFVLVSQNRQAQIADRRNELDLQIDLLSEHEMTRVLTLVNAIAKRMGLPECNDKELRELMNDVKPDEVLQELETRANGEKRSDTQQKAKQ